VLAADGVFYVIAAVRRAVRRGQSAAAAWRWALADQGLVSGAKAASFAVAFGLWLYSPVRLQAETGVLIVVATVIALVLALGALPALLLLMEESVAQHATEGSSPTLAETSPLQTGMHAATGL
jgi:predicted RND superfamily exporter protein